MELVIRIIGIITPVLIISAFGFAYAKLKQPDLSVVNRLSTDMLYPLLGAGNYRVQVAADIDFNTVEETREEIDPKSVMRSESGKADKTVDNLALVRASAEEIADALAGRTVLKRMKDIDLASYRFSTLFVDPPRSGLDAETEKMVQAYPRILYISCNPETLCKNLETLSQTHRVERLALFDQFPYTHHMECGVLLRRK